MGATGMDQVLFGLAGFLIGLAILYGIFRLAISPRRSWMPPPTWRTDHVAADGMGGPNHGPFGPHHGS